MIDLSKSDYNLVDGSYVTFCIDKTLRVEETTPDGSGVVKFSNPGAVIQIGNFKKRIPIEWLKNKACADGVIVTGERNNPTIHIVEIKTKLTMNKWVHSKKQFEGAALNAKSVLKILGIPDFDKVFCYISFISEEISAKKAVNPIHLKPLLGRGPSSANAGAWMSEKISFCGITDIPVLKIIRNPKNGVGEGALQS